jgi:NAD(P)-dependent dehydrogenase (short-subunit alcohol dehydrogenase family)
LAPSLAARAAQRGYRVGVLDIDEAKAHTVASTLDGAVALAADVTDEASVERAVAAFGTTPDLLVNNAAVTLFGSLIEQGIAGFRKVVDINLMGTFIPAWMVGRRMVDRGSGIIVNLTSINAITPRPNTGAYPTTKAAVAKLTEQMALEWGTGGRQGQLRGAGLHRCRHLGALLRGSGDSQATRQPGADGAAWFG